MIKDFEKAVVVGFGVAMGAAIAFAVVVAVGKTAGLLIATLN